MRTGRAPTATLDQRRSVYELADAGKSLRAIAEDVFGSRRLHNRVARLLARRRATSFPGIDVETATDDELDAAMRKAEAQLAALVEENGTAPS